MTEDPISIFEKLFVDAKAREPFEANAMTLATVDDAGRPSARIVLLKSVDGRGFVFFTNRRSRKGCELDRTKAAALVFHWPKGEEQVRIEGSVERTSDEESDAYFATRARGSQIGAWASLQSEELPSREALERRIQEVEATYAGVPVERPPHWGGYRVVPHYIEFWKGQPSRLHVRRAFKRDLASSIWVETRLYP